MHIYLVDLSLTFGAMQNHILHIADCFHKEETIPITICCPANSQLAQKAKEQKIPLLIFPNQNPKNIANVFKLWFASTKKCHCLIHTFSHASSLLGWFVTKLRKKKSTILVHTHKNTTILDVDKHNQMPKHWRNADMVICDSTHMLQLLADAGIKLTNLEKIPAGVDPTLLPKDVNNSKKRFIFASLSPKEAANSNEIIIKAMPFLWQNKELPDWEVRIFGRGLAANKLMEMAMSIGVESRLSILGNQNLIDVFPLCNALIVSNQLLTGGRLYLGAAWYSELGLICAKTLPNLELAKNDENALLYNCDEPQHLAYIMEKAMLNPELFASIIKNGKTMQPLVCIDRSVQQCYKLYMACIYKLGWIINKPKNKLKNKKNNNQIDE